VLYIPWVAMLEQRLNGTMASSSPSKGLGSNEKLPFVL
jgi:hypothetical protein